MKKNIFIAASLFVSLVTFAQMQIDLKTVSYVDPLKYIGRWYQISHNQLPFEPANCLCAQQTLGLNTDGTLSVYNSCRKDSVTGDLFEIRGFAVNDDVSSNSKFAVDFNLPKKGQYWIIGLAADYSWAVVSDPSRRSLYVLSKTPTLANDDYQKAVLEAATQLDISKLKMTDQNQCQYP